MNDNDNHDGDGQTKLRRVLSDTAASVTNAVTKSTRAIAEPLIDLATPVVVMVMQTILKPFQRFWRIIKPSRVPLIASIALSAFVVLNDQATDLLRVVEEEGIWSGVNLVLLAMLIVYALAAWYFSRAVLYVFYKSFTPFDEDDKEHRKTEPFRKFTARIIGLMPIVALAFAFLGISFALMIFYLLAALFFYVGLEIRRRYILPMMYASEDGATVIYVGLHEDGLTDTSRKYVVACSLLTFVVFLATQYSHIAFPTFMGTLGVIFVGAAGLVVFFTLMTYWSDFYELPSIIVLLIVGAAIIGLYNDNHSVRTLEDPEFDDSRLNVSNHFERWIKSRLSATGQKKDPYPVFLVAAEGGGIRAAYWTAAVLKELQEKFPEFACHLFSISGVSGGSLGGGAFVADLANAFDRGTYRCVGDPAETEVTTGVSAPGVDSGAKSLVFLGEDFLAPTVAGLLFPDLISRFNPLCPWLCLPDRATYLEQAWEENWHKHNPDAAIQFDDAFLDAWEGNARYNLPSLFLNGTWVENGGRNVTSNLRAEATEFSRVQDMVTTVNKHLRWSTAIHMSARFTYVSPPGTVKVFVETMGKEPEEKTLRVVDGGYFENSGTLTTKEILNVLERVCRKSLKDIKCTESFAFYAIVISNNTKSANADLGEKLAQNASRVTSGELGVVTMNVGFGDSNDADDSGTGPLLNEVLAPVRALLNTRVSRGILSEDELLTEISGNILRFQLRDPPQGNEIPLGWVLSSSTQSEIRRQARCRVADYATLLGGIGMLKQLAKVEPQDCAA